MPVQTSAMSHGPAAARHTTFDDANWSGGQVRETPSQNSATSQMPFWGRHIVVFGRGEHVPVTQLAQAPAHEELQQIPLTQNPDVHCEGVVHGWPLVPPPLATHVPFWQVPPGHGVPLASGGNTHVPFWGLQMLSVQGLPSSQNVSLYDDMQAPAWHVIVAHGPLEAHGWLQAPQWAKSLSRSTQVPPQLVSPLPHPVAHWPFVQT